MCSYYRNFVKNYSTVASPLTDLTRLNTPWDWSDECEGAFRRLKHALMNHEVLMVPDPQKPFIVTTDASQYGIGAVLAQQDGKKLRPIEYMSKKMPSKKLAKSIYERELYAICKALVHWRHFLLGRFFYLRTGHQTLKWIKTQPALSDALKRWIEVIDQYDFKLEYLKGEYNKVADALSRRADYLGQSVSMDFMDTLVTSKSSKRHIFVIIDRFTKYARLVAMPETARTDYVIKLFKDNWVRDFGLPKSIVNDRDVRFTSELWKKTAEQMGSQLQMTLGNHPEANGQAEQMNRVVQHLLRHYIKPNQDDWDEQLPLIANLYNNAVHSSTGVSPNQLHLGWKPRSALDFLLPENRPAATPDKLEYGVQYEKLLQEAVEHMKKAQQAMIASENRHRRQSTFQVGERVWVKASHVSSDTSAGHINSDTSAGHISNMSADIRAMSADTSSAQPGHVSRPVPRQYQPHMPPILWSVTNTMERKDNESGADNEARLAGVMLELKQRADAALDAREKREREIEEKHRLAILQQQANGDTAHQAADEARQTRQDVLFEEEAEVLTLASEMDMSTEEEGASETVRKFCKVIKRIVDLVATCMAQQALDNNVQTLTAHVHTLEQRPISAIVVGLSNIPDRVNALEIDIGTLKDGAKQQQATNQQL
ncbi:hypothetical protein CBR_g50262 [Chara braunii]|uniref:Integrase catalytic domain-containing protein n=1 Tax=Chara braunii TaxID=69332 RepID=A0A388M6F2_CHABU|nr:hypothetical protein CBR_g50262 [Chara braunii]|eukprot:GBG90168.1 hypothetical protein CBR_g50262 [Chara braunii]